MNLKIGGSNVGKIMYNGQEFGGATKLEPGTILYRSDKIEAGFKNIHLLSTTKNWNNLNGINIMIYNSDFSLLYESINISGDDFKNLDIDKEYNSSYFSLSVSRSIVDGEYRLNISIPNTVNFIIKAI
ncbi:hypothetical protein [Companilactobacillus kimchii]|uniref:Uncharacterized protein n=1 Tax=Companilactobacillus kimchii TaxID=2801452 RepID=A0A210P8K8_9LACO|nr:hypothetical protein [Companilactobacillus kimchii]KAE9561281.1 hypothetical protein ATN91_07525 [Companilactobacillus kimchii]OWF32808.1 hypothetical protein LKACC12383_01681 [Companilactobacillus kimchii]GEO48454.1 hypothetical protein LKI01_24530 [Companilactobacillus paralimentarius]